MEIEISQNIDFEIICDTCGRGLDVAKENFRNGTINLKIEPCSTCLDKADGKGYDRGYDEGETNAVEGK